MAYNHGLKVRTESIRVLQVRGREYTRSYLLHSCRRRRSDTDWRKSARSSEADMHSGLFRATRDAATWSLLPVGCSYGTAKSNVESRMERTGMLRGCTGTGKLLFCSVNSETRKNRPEQMIIFEEFFI